MTAHLTRVHKSAAVLVTAVALLVGCTGGDDDPKPTDSSSPTSGSASPSASASDPKPTGSSSPTSGSASPSASPKPTGSSSPTSGSFSPSVSASDHSKALLDEAVKQQPATSVAGRLSTAFTYTDDIKATVPATIAVHSVRTSAAGTVLDWEVSASSEARLMTLWTPGFYTGKVRLFDPQGKKFYEVVTPTGDEHALASKFPDKVGSAPTRLSAEYPPLPESVTSVEVVAPNFAKATIPVSR